MSEEQPLLSDRNSLTGRTYDAEANLVTDEEEADSWRGRVGNVLESKRLHKTVIALVRMLWCSNEDTNNLNI